VPVPQGSSRLNPARTDLYWAYGEGTVGLVLAGVCLAIAILALIAYGGTPHGGPTASCGPINVVGHSFTLSTDCRYVSIGELAVAGLFFFLAIAAAVSARPRGPVR
jgi:hypothetical protein